MSPRTPCLAITSRRSACRRSISPLLNAGKPSRMGIDTDMSGNPSTIESLARLPHGAWHIRAEHGGRQTEEPRESLDLVVVQPAMPMQDDALGECEDGSDVRTLLLVLDLRKQVTLSPCQTRCMSRLRVPYKQDGDEH